MVAYDCLYKIFGLNRHLLFDENTWDGAGLELMEMNIQKSLYLFSRLSETIVKQFLMIRASTMNCKSIPQKENDK